MSLWVHTLVVILPSFSFSFYFFQLGMCYQVKDGPAYIAVSSNTSGATAKDLFEDVVEELDKQVKFYFQLFHYILR